MSFAPHDITTSFDFPKEEEKVLAFWREIDAFQTSLKLSEGRPEYSFYDGPPFATGLPHYGHLLARFDGDMVSQDALPRTITLVNQMETNLTADTQLALAA
jgi:isoleucyl-tRNA synthetase